MAPLLRKSGRKLFTLGALRLVTLERRDAEARSVPIPDREIDENAIIKVLENLIDTCRILFTKAPESLVDGLPRKPVQYTQASSAALRERVDREDQELIRARRKSCTICTGLCLTFGVSANVKQLLGRLPNEVENPRITLFTGTYGGLTDWAVRGCPFARLLYASLPHQLGPKDDINLSIGIPHGLGESGIEILELYESSLGKDKSCVIRYSCFTSPGDPAKRYVSGWPISAEPLSTRNLSFMLGFLDSCISRHSECSRDIAGRDSLLPSRVIDVGSSVAAPKVKLQHSAGQRGEYVALSYCWGGAQPLQTTLATLKSYTHGITMARLPSTIKDAILVTRYLGFRFLWIDSLCIIQDDEDDRNRELACMARTYQCATLTLSASTSATASDGFLQPHIQTALEFELSAHLTFVCPMTGCEGSVLMYPARRMSEDLNADELPIDTRAWCFQELLLSRRMISFLPDRIQFRCGQMCETTDGLEWVRKELKLSSDALSTIQSMPPELHGPPLQRAVLSSHEGALLQECWWDIVYGYSTRDLTSLHDKLPAIAALASVFATRTGDTYVAGLWRHWLVAGLNWTALGIQGFAENKQRSTDQLPYRGPTWSWVSVTRSVVNSFRPLSEWRTTARVLDVSVKLKSPQVLFGEVTDARLVLKCKVKQLTPYEIWRYFVRSDEKPDGEDRSVIGSLDLDERAGYDWGWRSTITSPSTISPVLTFAELCREPGTHRRCGLLLLSAGTALQRIGYIRITDELISGVALGAQQTQIMARWHDSYKTERLTLV